MGSWGSAGESHTASQLQLQQSLMSPKSAPPPLPATMLRRWNWWLTVAVNTLLLLAGQTAATLLGRFYYDEGGNSKWMQTLTLSAAFPILYLPLLLTPSPPPTTHQPPLVKLSLIYIVLGLITTADSLMYSYGLLYLSVSTYSLVCATQLGFNAVFSYFINKEKFTVLTLNSVVLLTFSAAIVGIRSGSDSLAGTPASRYMLGFILTLAASALYSLILSLMELTFERVVRSQTFTAVYNMQIYTALVSTLAAAMGLFASGEWRGLRADMDGFRRGRVAYVMTLVWTAVAWQVTNVGLVGLIFEVSSLFSNVMSTVAIPLAPVFSVIFLRDRMDGLKVISLLLAIWGFVSYFYQHYLEYKEEKERNMVNGTADVSAA